MFEKKVTKQFPGNAVLFCECCHCEDHSDSSTNNFSKCIKTYQSEKSPHTVPKQKIGIEKENFLDWSDGLLLKSQLSYGHGGTSEELILYHFILQIEAKNENFMHQLDEWMNRRLMAEKERMSNRCVFDGYTWE